MEKSTASFEVKKGLAQMLKGGVIMDVVNTRTCSHCRRCRSRSSYGT